MATDAIKSIEKALEKAFDAKDAKVVVWVDKSDYKDFVRMYVVSDYFRGMSEKERLSEIYSMLEEYGAKEIIGKISLCIAMTNREYEEEFGEGVWLGVLDKVYRGMKSRPRVRRLARIQTRN